MSSTEISWSDAANEQEKLLKKVNKDFKFIKIRGYE